MSGVEIPSADHMDIKLDSLQTVFIALMCLVPGFILHSTYSLFTIRRVETKELLYLRFAAFTALNFAFCLPWIRFILAPGFFKNHPYITAHYFAGVIFGSPILTGLVIAIADNWQIVKKVARICGLKTMHSIPTAWDYRFSQLGREGPRYVIVTFKDGKQIGGLFYNTALASSESTERDIYLIDTHTRDANDPSGWIRQPGNDGILIMANEVRSFEFFHTPNTSESGRNVAVRRARHLTKRMRVQAEAKVAPIRWMGSRARQVRDCVRKIRANGREYIIRIDKESEEEKRNAIR
jgi:hypothetical protein